MIVADTNLIVHLLLPGAGSAEADRVFRRDPDWAAPLLWRSELSNVLATYQRRRALALRQALTLMEDAELLMEAAQYTVPSEPVLRTVAESGCTAYDAEFVVLARDLAVPLVTSDRQLLEAFPDLALPAGAFGGGS